VARVREFVERGCPVEFALMKRVDAERLAARLVYRGDRPSHFVLPGRR